MAFVARMLTADEADRARSDDEYVEDLLFEDDPCDDPDIRTVDLDKSWHGIHWLLTGTSYGTDGPMAGAIFGGVEIGEDLGYGAARLLDPEVVAGVAAALEPLDADTLSNRMDAAAMTAADLYPSIWDEPDVFDTYLRPNYEALRAFYSRAAADGRAVLQAIT
jgi:hypothetical protein